MNPGDFAKYAAEKQASPWASFAGRAGKAFLGGIGGRGGAAGGTKAIQHFGLKASNRAGKALGFAMENPGTTAIGAGVAYKGYQNMFGQGGQQQHHHGNMYGG